jgi:hypothetical protein
MLQVQVEMTELPASLGSIDGGLVAAKVPT